MKLKLQNFRCYTEYDLDFGKGGMVLLSGPSGAGKCLGKDTPILMYDGSIKPVQTVKQEDFVMGEDSLPKRVLSTTTGCSELYRIVPKKGTPYIVNKYHLLTLKVAPPTLYYNGKEWFGDYTDGLGNLCTIKFESREEGSVFFHTIPYNGTIDIPVTAYVALSKASKKRLFTYHTGVVFQENKIRREKWIIERDTVHIPYYYRVGSVSERTACLDALTNAYGTSVRNKFILRLPKHSIPKDIEYLILSLGYLCYVLENETIIYYKSKEKACQRFKVEYLGEGDYFGFQIEGSSARFLLGDFTVTHNSSILHSISFALYGTGTKVASYGKTSCKVEMEFRNLYIVRTKRPNRLVVKNLETGEELEDESAQSVINQLFGNAFEVTSYVPQDNSSSFVMLSPIEKLEFLEKFAFHDVDLTKVKTACKNMIKERHEQLLTITSQLELAISLFQNIQKPDKVSFPFKSKDEKTLKNEQIRYKNTQTLLRRALRSKEQVQVELSARNVLLAKITTSQKYSKTLVEKIGSLAREREEAESMYIGDKQLIAKEDELSQIVNQREYTGLLHKYKEDEKRLLELQTEELKQASDELTRIENILWKEYSPSQIVEIIKETKQLYRDIQTIEQYEKELENYSVEEKEIKEKKELLVTLKQQDEKYRKMKFQQQKYKCPSCEVTLCFHEDTLKVVGEEDLKIELTNDVSKHISKLQLQLAEYQAQLQRKQELVAKKEELEKQYEELPEKSEVEADLEYLLNYKRSHEEFAKKKVGYDTTLKDKIFSGSLQTLEKGIETSKKKLENMAKHLKEVVPGNELQVRELLETQRHLNLKIKSLLGQLKESEVELQKLTEETEHETRLFQKTFSVIREVSDIETEKKELEKQIDELQNKEKQHESNLKQVEKYKQYEEELKRYKEMKERVEILKKQEKEAKEKYSAVTILREKIGEAESMAMSQIIESINVHAQEYLDLFFPDNPIVVRLQPFKESKKGLKSQINLQVDYKGMEADLSMLSGGETSRVILAYTLALAEIFNSPLILLDESTASLDQELTNTVIEGIRKNFTDKLVVIIAHQTVSGIFDREYNLVKQQ